MYFKQLLLMAAGQSMTVLAYMTGSDRPNVQLEFDLQDELVIPKSVETPISTITFSIVWYIVTFTAVLIFFMAMACSDGLCKKTNNQDSRTLAASIVSIESITCPPSYDEFAPPSYESITATNERCERNRRDIGDSKYCSDIFIISDEIK